MADVTQLLSQIEAGDGQAADQLLPLVYEELRRLAQARLTRERPGQTLQATALVHEAFVRLVQADAAQPWRTRGHFFAAAARAMRRILVEHARRRQRIRHGGHLQRLDADVVEVAAPEIREDLLALDAALDRLAESDPAAAELVQLRYFAGLSMADIAAAMDISTRTADRLWVFAKAWLHRELNQ